MGRKRKPESERISCLCDRKTEPHWRWPSGQCYTEIDLEGRRARRHDNDVEKQRQRVRKNSNKPEYVGQRKRYQATEKGKEALLRSVQARRARVENAVGSNPPKAGWKRRQFDKQKGLCYYCGEGCEMRTMHQEHMTPLKRGGLHDVSNLVLSCKTCNFRKHTMTAEEFINEYMEDRPGLRASNEGR